MDAAVSLDFSATPAGASDRHIQTCSYWPQVTYLDIALITHNVYAKVTYSRLISSATASLRRAISVFPARPSGPAALNFLLGDELAVVFSRLGIQLVRSYVLSEQATAVLDGSHAHVLTSFSSTLLTIYT